MKKNKYLVLIFGLALAQFSCFGQDIGNEVIESWQVHKFEEFSELNGTGRNTMYNVGLNSHFFHGEISKYSSSGLGLSSTIRGQGKSGIFWTGTFQLFFHNLKREVFPEDSIEQYETPGNFGVSGGIGYDFKRFELEAEAGVFVFGISEAVEENDVVVNEAKNSQTFSVGAKLSYPLNLKLVKGSVWMDNARDATMHYNYFSLQLAYRYLFSEYSQFNGGMLEFGVVFNWVRKDLDSYKFKK